MTVLNQEFKWPDNQKCAVTLTYDDALTVHREKTAFQLTKKGLEATFYVPGQIQLTNYIDAWREISKLGHELGNHTLFHPCRRDPIGSYQWVPQHYDLQDYTPERWMDEIRVANCLLSLIDGKKERTFGNTCCQTFIGRESKKFQLKDYIEEFFIAGRGPLNSTLINPTNIEYGELGHFIGDHKTCEELKNDVMKAANSNSWIIFMFHGVGKGTHGMFIDEKEHNVFTDFLAQNRDQFWTTSVVNIAKYIKNLPVNG